MKVKHKLLACIYFCFNPMLFIMSSIINNDGLLFLTMTAAFYYALSWWQKQTFKTTFKAGVWGGLCLMTKLNGVLIVLVTLVLFGVRFMQNIKERKAYLKQFSVYLLLVGLLGGWYYGYAYQRYETPVSYIQGDNNPHSDIGYYHTMYERLTHDEWSNKYVDLAEGQNWNMLALGLKTSVFDEHNYSYNEKLNQIGTVLFYVSVIFFFVICFCSLYTFFYSAVSKWKAPVLICIFYMGVFLLSYVYFNYKFPHPYTANFRYIPTFFICAICLWDKLLNDKTVLFYALPLVISISSVLFHTFYLRMVALKENKCGNLLKNGVLDGKNSTYYRRRSGRTDRSV